jgi:excisionase family DNA binding protein
VTELPLVLTVEEAARALRIGRGSAYEAVRQGAIPAVRIGRTLRIPRHSLLAMLDDESSPNGDAPAAQTGATRKPGAAGHDEAY